MTSRYAMPDMALGHVIGTAATLLSEGGENPEYDRALVELCARLYQESRGFDNFDHDGACEVVGFAFTVLRVTS